MGMTQPEYDIDKLLDDLADLGWLPADLARKTGYSRETISRVLNRERANPPTMKSIAEAMGHKVGRYLIRRRPVAAGVR